MRSMLNFGTPEDAVSKQLQELSNSNPLIEGDEGELLVYADRPKGYVVVWLCCSILLCTAGVIGLGYLFYKVNSGSAPKAVFSWWWIAASLTFLGVLSGLSWRRGAFGPRILRASKREIELIRVSPHGETKLINRAGLEEVDCVLAYRYSKGLFGDYFSDPRSEVRIVFKNGLEWFPIGLTWDPETCYLIGARLALAINVPCRTRSGRAIDLEFYQTPESVALPDLSCGGKRLRLVISFLVYGVIGLLIGVVLSFFERP
ncbi:MAG: hypothetical protein KDB07_07920 [Planctomycetes bacterium]|nr:hypothetical protein [Planctomycetota bacterium]